MSERRIIFYDGECALCHGFVNFVLQRDVKGLFHFSPLQGERIKEVLSETARRQLPDSVAYFDEFGALFVRSEAVIRVLRLLPGWPPLAAQFIALFPRGFRDAVYDLVARFRKRVFGTKNQLCPIVPEEIRSRLLP